MAEHRLSLDPGIIRRLAGSMETISDAWAGDLAELRRVEDELAETKRTLNAATDRASDLQGDLRSARQENTDLIRRNAHLEAQVQKLYENSLDAKDALEQLATRAVEAARTTPAAESQWRDPEKIPPGAADEPPASFRRPAEVVTTSRDARLPGSPFQQSRQAVN